MLVPFSAFGSLAGFSLATHRAGYPDSHPDVVAASARGGAGTDQCISCVHSQWRATRGPFASWGGDAYTPQPPPLFAVQLLVQVRAHLAGCFAASRYLNLSRGPESCINGEVVCQDSPPVLMGPAIGLLQLLQGEALAFSPPLSDLQAAALSTFDAVVAAGGRVEDVAARVRRTAVMNAHDVSRDAAPWTFALLYPVINTASTFVRLLSHLSAGLQPGLRRAASAAAAVPPGRRRPQGARGGRHRPRPGTAGSPGCGFGGVFRTSGPGARRRICKQLRRLPSPNVLDRASLKAARALARVHHRRLRNALQHGRRLATGWRRPGPSWSALHR